MDWLHALDDATPLAAVFGDLSVISSTVTLHDLTVLRDGPSVRLRLDLSEFPASPPAKWRDSDTVQVTLSLDDVSALHLEGIGTSMVVTLEAERDPATQTVTWTLRSSSLNASVTSRFSRIATLTAYSNGL